MVSAFEEAQAWLESTPVDEVLRVIQQNFPGHEFLVRRITHMHKQGTLLTSGLIPARVAGLMALKYHVFESGAAGEPAAVSDPYTDPIAAEPSTPKTLF